MSKEPDNSHMDSGFDLDKIEGVTKSFEKAYKGNSPNEHVSEISPLQTPRKNDTSDFKIISMCVIVVIVATVGAAFFRNRKLSLSFLSVNNGSPQKQYLRVGPIFTTISNGDIIELAMDIGCGNELVKKRLAAKEAIVRNLAITIVSSPEAARLFETHQYDIIKSQIRASLEKTFNVPVNVVYFSELRTY